MPNPDLSFMTGETDLFWLPLNFALIVPGSSPKMKVKDGSENFAYIANTLISNKITPVLIGGKDDLDIINAIQERCPNYQLNWENDYFPNFFISAESKSLYRERYGPMHLIAFGMSNDSSVWSWIFPR